MVAIAPRERTFFYNDMTFHAQEWGEPGGLPVLALHGWLDNAASFYRLAPLLKHCHIIAVDMAGHGRSDHRPGNHPYNLLSEVNDVYGIAELLGWEKFALLGHSRGAIVSMLTAGTFPERVSAVVMIDGLWPLPVLAAETPQILAQSILENNNLRKIRHPVYTSVELMKRALVNSRWGYLPEAADALLERGITEVEGGYIWSTSPHLKTASSFKLTEEHIEAFVTRIVAPVQLIVATEGLPKMFANYEADVALFTDIDVVTMAGKHHLHMGPEAVKLADTINSFFAKLA